MKILLNLKNGSAAGNVAYSNLNLNGILVIRQIDDTSPGGTILHQGGTANGTAYLPAEYSNACRYPILKI